MHLLKRGKRCKISSLRSKRFRRVWEQRKTEERGFRYFACAENGAIAKKRTSSPCNSLLPNCTETLATQATRFQDSFFSARKTFQYMIFIQ